MNGSQNNGASDPFHSVAFYSLLPSHSTPLAPSVSGLDRQTFSEKKVRLSTGGARLGRLLLLY